MSDSYQSLHPLQNIFSRYYGCSDNSEGASRIDRMYHYGGIIAKEASYVGVAFSDHHALVMKFTLPDSLTDIIPPKSCHLFEANPSVVKDSLFKDRLKDKFALWKSVQANMGIMVGWEHLVKPGIKKLLMERGRELKRENRGKLNLLLIRQAFLVKKIHGGCLDRIREHKEVQMRINAWYEEENRKVKLQSRIDDTNNSEKVTIFHHDLHQKIIKKIINFKTFCQFGYNSHWTQEMCTAA